MSKLEDLQPNASLRGVLPDVLVTVVNVQWFGSDALELTYKDPSGKLGSELLYRHDEPRLAVAEQGHPWPLAAWSNKQGTSKTTSPTPSRWEGAACHGCALLAETSYEVCNDYLDRALVVPVAGLSDASFFSQI